MKKVTILLIAILFATCSFGQASIEDYEFTYSTETYQSLTDAAKISGSLDFGYPDNTPHPGEFFNFILANTMLNDGWYHRLSITKNMGGTNRNYGVMGIDHPDGDNFFWPNQTNDLSYTADDYNYPVIAYFWDINFTYLHDAQGGDKKAKYKITGTSPNQILKVQVKYGIDEDNYVEVQLWLYETSNNIEFHYGPKIGLTADVEASIGIIALNQEFISVTPNSGSPTISATTSNHTIPASQYPGEGMVYTFSPPTPTIDVGIVNVSSPYINTAIGEHSIKVELENFSNVILTECDIKWWVNDVPQTTFEWTGELGYNETEENINIGSFDFSTPEQDYIIRVKSENPNGDPDGNLANDEFITTIHTYSPLSIPYYQNFNETELNEYWYIDVVDPDRGWLVKTPEEYSFDGTNFMRIEDDGSFAHTDYLYSPIFDATNLIGGLYVGWDNVMNTNEYFPEDEYLSLEIYKEGTWHEVFKSTDEFESFDNPTEFYLLVNDYISENFQLRFKYVGNTITGGTAIPIWNIDNFYIDLVVENDLGLEYTGPAFGHPEQDIYPRAIIKNYGVLTANDFSVTIQIGDYISTKEITGANLEYNDTIIVTMPDAWTPTETGTASVNSSITFVNDENPDNNTFTGTAKIMDEFIQPIYYQVTTGGNSSFVIAELQDPTSYTIIKDDMFPDVTVGGTYIEETEQIYMATKRNLWDVDIYNGIAFAFSEEKLVLSNENHFANVWIQGITYNETNSTMYLTVVDLPIVSNHLFTANLINKTVTDVSTDMYWGNDYYGRILAIGSDVNGDVFAIRAQNTFASPPTRPVINKLILPEGEESDNPILIGEIDLGVNNDLEFDKTTNTCYFIKNEYIAKGDFQTTLNIINPETAEITQIGDFGTNTDITGLVVTPSVHPNQITFNITDAITTDPINNAKVTINNENYYTDASGSVTFGIYSGTYTYTVFADDYMVESEEITIEDETTVDVILYQATAVNFVVTDINTSTGIDGAIININGTDYETADGGLVTIFLISNNDYDYTITNYAYQTIEDNFSLENTPLDIETKMIPLKQLSFTIYQTATTTTLENVDINISNGVDNWNETTDSNGQAIFYLISGNYQYNASLSGYYTGEDYIEVNQDIEKDIYLDLLNNNIKDNVNNYFKIYPNPSNGIFIIETLQSFQNFISYTITDVTGKVIYMTMKHDPEQINLSNQPVGVYFITIKTNTGVYTEKLIIQ